jgi:UPF0755 protein
VIEIANRLDEQKAILHPLLFRAAAKLMAENNLKAGEYRLTLGLSVLDIATMMRDGQSVLRQFTIPEGLTSHEIVDLLAQVDGLTGEVDAVPKEGSLMPETYRFSLGQSRKELIARMQDDQKKLLEELWEKRQSGLPFNASREALILASVVEKETGFRAEERARVAGVFINRLRRGMPLQSDPTVIYAVTKGQNALGRALLRTDLKIASPYNTYENAGLPPDPICNPGRAALEATLNPETNDYYYFVADGSGGHAFSRTLDEHNRNVARWKSLKKP